MSDPKKIPEQISVSWATAFVVSWSGVKRRMLRSLITMAGVIFAIAFLTYMLTIENVNQSLVAAAGGDGKLSLLLQESGVDILSGGKIDQLTMLLLGLSLLTCAIGITNSMFMSVTERTREIGTLKCLGAKDRFIVQAYLIESSLQGICGAMLGMLLGCVVAIAVLGRLYGMYAFTHFPPGPVAVSLLISFVCGAVMSVMAAILPAYMAAKKQPVEALRVEE